MISSRPPLRLAVALLAAVAPLASFLAEAPAARAQAATVTWERKAYGQLRHVPGHEDNPFYDFHYPDNNAWSQSAAYQLDGNGNVWYQTEPSNWTTEDFPNGNVAVVLGATRPAAAPARRISTVASAPGSASSALPSRRSARSTSKPAPVSPRRTSRSRATAN